ncbi:hypothetical protein JKP88DRAFT_266940 [Tribonema minus]|uniref:Uncharacterized protein n=1 Tax=Tribonema minus TaxID=303371 RepID=A0A836CP45_9STRA|nr:hypothetical protein JKP88DRAFT_266940 [Tribonema minus]
MASSWHPSAVCTCPARSDNFKSGDTPLFYAVEVLPAFSLLGIMRSILMALALVVEATHAFVSQPTAWRQQLRGTCSAASTRPVAGISRTAAAQDGCRLHMSSYSLDNDIEMGVVDEELTIGISGALGFKKHHSKTNFDVQSTTCPGRLRSPFAIRGAVVRSLIHGACSIACDCEIARLPLIDTNRPLESCCLLHCIAAREYALPVQMREGIAGPLKVLGSVVELIDSRDNIFTFKYNGQIRNKIGIEAYARQMIQEIYPDMEVLLFTNRVRDNRDD